MTDRATNRPSVKSNILPRAAINASLTIAALISTFIITLFLSDKISHSVKSGLSLCANVIIPSVFPFIVLSDFLYTFLNFSSLKCIGNAFERIFKINRYGLYPFILGIICGFPLGVKCATELYLDGKIARDECERLIGFCNNTGPAFLVCGIGLGLRNNIRDGFLLYFAMIISAILTGIIFSYKKSPATIACGTLTKKRFSVTESIKNAGLNTLNICSYLVFFACIVGLMRNLLGESHIYLTLIPFLEVGSATSILSKTALLTNWQSLALSAFAIGFSGFSVHLQAMSFISKTDLSVSRYFAMKLIQGVISYSIIILLSLFLN